MNPNRDHGNTTARGAHPFIVQNLPHVERPTEATCSICMEEGEDVDSAGGGGWTRLAPCGHCFHRACCARWLRRRHTCPLCRVPVQLNTDEMTTRQLLDLLAQLGIERDHTVVERQELASRLQTALASAPQ